MGPLGSKSQERILSANSEKEKKGGDEGLGHPGELAFEWGGGRKEGRLDRETPHSQPRNLRKSGWTTGCLEQRAYGRNPH